MLKQQNLSQVFQTSHQFGVGVLRKVGVGVGF